jgi:hypothetical protein
VAALEIARSISLPHPPEDVFVAVMSPEIAPQIDPAVERWQPDSRPIGVGTTFEIRGKFQWLPIRGVSRISVWDPPRRGEFDSVKPSWPLQMHAVHTFEPEGSGTRYTWSMTMRPRNRIGQFVARRVKPLIERTIADQNRTLAAWLDAHPGAAGAAEL